MFGFFKKKKPKETRLDLHAEEARIIAYMKETLGVDPEKKSEKDLEKEKSGESLSVTFKLELGTLSFMLFNPRETYNYAEMVCYFLRYYNKETYPSNLFCHLYNNSNTFMRKSTIDSIETVRFEHWELNLNSETLMRAVVRTCEEVTSEKFRTELIKYDKKPE